MEAYGVIGWCSCFISSPWGVFPCKALSIVHGIVIAIAANMLVDILLIIHRKIKDQLIQCYYPFIPQQMVRLLACIYRWLHEKKRKTNKALVLGLGSDVSLLDPVVLSNLKTQKNRIIVVGTPLVHQTLLKEENTLCGWGGEMLFQTCLLCDSI